LIKIKHEIAAILSAVNSTHISLDGHINNLGHLTEYLNKATPKKVWLTIKSFNKY
jgi:hypothetical protein